VLFAVTALNKMFFCRLLLNHLLRWRWNKIGQTKIHSQVSLLQKDGFVIPEAVIGNQAFEKSKSYRFPLSREWRKIRQQFILQEAQVNQV
jgi:hypothetical protein